MRIRHEFCLTLRSHIPKVQSIKFLLLLLFYFQSKWVHFVCDPNGYFQPSPALDAKLKKCPVNDVRFSKLHTIRSILSNPQSFVKLKFQTLCINLVISVLYVTYCLLNICSASWHAKLRSWDGLDLISSIILFSNTLQLVNSVSIPLQVNSDGSYSLEIFEEFIEQVAAPEYHDLVLNRIRECWQAFGTCSYYFKFYLKCLSMRAAYYY